MQLDEKDRAVIGKYGQMLSVSLRIIESSAQVNVDQYKEHCKTAYIHLINELPWVSITHPNPAQIVGPLMGVDCS